MRVTPGPGAIAGFRRKQLTPCDTNFRGSGADGPGCEFAVAGACVTHASGGESRSEPGVVGGPD
jgi:hypothetical protein